MSKRQIPIALEQSAYNPLYAVPKFLIRKRKAFTPRQDEGFKVELISMKTITPQSEGVKTAHSPITGIILPMSAKNREFPDTAGCYVIRDGLFEKIAYIGQTSNMRKRIAGHKRLPWTHEAYLTFMPIEDPKARLATEAFLLPYYHPLLNRLYKNQPRFIDSYHPHWNARWWGRWQYCCFDWVLTLWKNNKRVYSSTIIGMKHETILFEANNITGMGHAEDVADLWSAAYALTPDSLGGVRG